jgi:hypothetical protein
MREFLVGYGKHNAKIQFGSDTMLEQMLRYKSRIDSLIQCQI